MVYSTKLDKFASSVPVCGKKYPFSFVDLTGFAGQNGEAIIVSIFKTPGKTLYVKLKGRRASVIAERDLFLAFCRTIKY